LIYVFPDFGKCFNVWHEAIDILNTDAQQLGGHVSVLPPRKFWVKAHAQFQHGRHAPRHAYAASRRLRGSSDEFEQGAFACTVDADDANGFPGKNFKIDVLQDPLELMPLLMSR
jgi:hypothetical protein